MSESPEEKDESRGSKSDPAAPAEAQEGRPSKKPGAKKTKAARTATADKKASNKKAADKKALEEEEPILSGRMIIAVALIMLMLVLPWVPDIRNAITRTAPRTTARDHWKVGQTAHVHVTVVTADYQQMACAHKRSRNGWHCEYADDHKRWPHDPDEPVDNNRANVLQPYRTTDKQLLFMAGLWAQPEVATRLHEEPSRGVGKSKLARFVVDCEVRFVEEWPNAVVRWSPSEKWADQGTAMVAEVLSCHILEDQQS